MPGPKPSGLPRRTPLGVAVPPQVLEGLDALLEELLRIQAVLHQKGVSIPGYPTTRSALVAWMVEEGVTMANRALRGIGRIRAQKYSADDIAIVENSPLWHLVLYHFPREQAFPPPRDQGVSELPQSSPLPSKPKKSPVPKKGKPS